MKRTVNVLRLNWAKRACAVFALCAAKAIALPAQTLTTLVTFNGTNGGQPQAGACPNYQWVSLRDNIRGDKNIWCWDDFHNHPGWRAHDATHLLGYRRRRAPGGAGPGHQWLHLYGTSPGGANGNGAVFDLS